jgi:hypothetical protein
MKRIRKHLTMLGLASLLVGATLVASPQPARADQAGFNDRYVFAATRSVDDMDAPTALKITLFPVTVALDTAFLPFAVIAGYVA